MAGGAAGAYPRIIVAEGKDVQAIALQAVAANERTIVAGGGDGTVSTIGAELAGTGITMGVLPLGTLDHFARDLRKRFIRLMKFVSRRAGGGFSLRPMARLGG